MSEIDLKTEIRSALGALKGGALQKTSLALFEALGYSSGRMLALDGSPRAFVDQFPPLFGREDTKTEREFRAAAESVHIVFQLTNEEIMSSAQMNLFDGENFDRGNAKSFLFTAVKLKPGNYARGKYAEMTREINKRFAMPAVVLFTNDSKATFAFVGRRPHKSQTDRDVLNKVSLIRDVDCNKPHRAHLDILAELSLGQRITWMEKNNKQQDFDGLLAAWLAKLDTEELNRRFYKELLGWYEWAMKTAKFPCPKNKPVPMGDHIIRLITRILFVWFVKEKGLVSEDLFIKNRIAPLLKGQCADDDDDYYRAVLQNLFFATLNTEIRQRSFSAVSNTTHRNFNRYRYKDLLSAPDQLLELMEQTPFINGGLFDCLDSEESTSDNGYRLDCFTDNQQHRKQLSVPNRLFFDDQDGLFPLLNKYKFTVEENTPIEQEVALDPELLGKVFENLLAAYNPETRETARKQTGSYYTPRVIVDYMVDEALSASLTARVKPADDDAEWLQERLRYLLDHADAFDDAQELFQEKEIKGIVKAISDIKVLDPAVGSGAFPMGMLHKLALALRRIDPDNKIWEALQKERAQKRAKAAFDTVDKEARSKELWEISDTFEHYRDSDFGRKLYLIQNSLFGVDIQPIACQIAKLRFFISLAIEQQPTDDASKNFGIKPLPNLETRFVAANTLIGLRLDGKEMLESDAIKRLEQALQQNRERHFNAGIREEKLDCAKKDKELRGKLAEELEDHYQRDAVGNEAKRVVDEKIKELDRQLRNYRRKIEAGKQENLLGNDETQQSQASIWDREIAKLEAAITKKQELANAIVRRDESIKSSVVWREAEKTVKKHNEQIHADAQKIAAWDPYDQNAQADWFDAEWMYGVRDGFDIVIGNPPYVQLQKDGGKLGKLFQNFGFKTFTKSGDIYQLFYEKGMNLLKETQGILVFITSNSWMRAQYGKKLRQFFSEEHSPLRLIDVGKDAFDAIVDTNILLVSEGDTEQEFKAVDMDSVPDKHFPPANRYWSEIRPSGDAVWSILSPAEQAIRSKIERTGTPLKEWDIQIKFGIKTGCNEAFIIDNEKRNELIAADPKSAEIIKPIVRGRDIRRYRYEWAGKWLIYARKGIQIARYSAIHNHFLQHQERLSKKAGANAWYELQASPSDTLNALFEQSKLIWIELVNRGRFTYDNKAIYCEATTFMLTGSNLKYLCAILNSNLIHWYLSQIAPTSGMGTLRWKKIYVKEIPIPLLNKQKQKPFVDLVSKILTTKNKKTNADTAHLEAEIDQLVYQLYGLTEKEIKLVETGQANKTPACA